MSSSPDSLVNGSASIRSRALTVLEEHRRNRERATSLASTYSRVYSPATANLPQFNAVLTDAYTPSTMPTYSSHLLSTVPASPAATAVPYFATSSSSSSSSSSSLSSSAPPPAPASVSAVNNNSSLSTVATPTSSNTTNSSTYTSMSPGLRPRALLTQEYLNQLRDMSMNPSASSGSSSSSSSYAYLTPSSHYHTSSYSRLHDTTGLNSTSSAATVPLVPASAAASASPVITATTSTNAVDVVRDKLRAKYFGSPASAASSLDTSPQPQTQPQPQPQPQSPQAQLAPSSLSSSTSSSLAAVSYDEYVAVQSFRASNELELALAVGDRLVVLKKTEKSGMWFGRLISNHEIGLFPSACVSPLSEFLERQRRQSADSQAQSDPKPAASPAQAEPSASNGAVDQSWDADNKDGDEGFGDDDIREIDDDALSPTSSPAARSSKASNGSVGNASTTNSSSKPKPRPSPVMTKFVSLKAVVVSSYIAKNTQELTMKAGIHVTVKSIKNNQLVFVEDPRGRVGLFPRANLRQVKTGRPISDDDLRNLAEESSVVKTLVMADDDEQAQDAAADDNNDMDPDLSQPVRFDVSLASGRKVQRWFWVTSAGELVWSRTQSEVRKEGEIELRTVTAVSVSHGSENGKGSCKVVYSGGRTMELEWDANRDASASSWATKMRSFWKRRFSESQGNKD